uniref:Ribosomal protein S3 n=1 Tax=Lithothamnion sp. TaxID=1940749 RepID=A0A3G3MIJ2_9FLOR|nr:ribosomal protein S3 [Lithothamnion sp.]
MSQKINPISNKLGISQIWDTTFSKYGKNFKVYNKLFYKQFKVQLYLTFLLVSKNFCLDKITINFTNKNLFVNIFVFDIDNVNFTPKVSSLLRTNSAWLIMPIIFNFYKKLNLTNSAFLLSNYFLSLAFKENSPKKILKNIYTVLKDQTGKFKVIYTTQGIKKVKLKGFKLQLSGCFEPSRTQMARTIQCNFGSLPLTTLNGYTEYSNSTLYTKFGSCGLKIWLFYEFKYL